MQTARRGICTRVMKAFSAAIIGLSAALAMPSAALPADKHNPTCPDLASISFGPDQEMLSFRKEFLEGKAILIVEGDVELDDSERLDAAIARSGPIDEIWLRSPGGVAAEGPRIGKVIRKWNLATHVPDGWGCASACTMAFLGGRVRSVAPGGVYAVHIFSAVNNKDYQADIRKAKSAKGERKILYYIARREQSAAQLATEENDYAIRMGVSRKLLSEIIYRQKQDDLDDVSDKKDASGKKIVDRSTIRCLTQSEMRYYNVINAD